MADDNNQRPYRTNEPPPRGQPAKGPGAAAGAGSSNDPLAELARLIGQNDPFSEFGRDGARRAAPPSRESESALDWAAPVERPAQPEHMPDMGFPPQPAAPAADNYYAAAAPVPGAQPFGSPNFGRQPFGSAPLAADGDLYQVEAEAPGYQSAPADDGYEHEPYPASNAQLGPEEDDYYDDVPPNRRRIGIIAIAGVFALAVIGTAGAFGYRALFGSSSSTLPPPVIKADSAPSKIVPAASSRDAQSGKLITDRVNERGQGERLVSREEQPIAIGDQKPANIVLPQSQDGAMASPTPPLGSGIVGPDPKRVRTIVIRPEQGMNAPAAAPMAESEPAPASAPVRITNITPARTAPAAQPMRIVNSPDPDPEPTSAPRQPVTRAAPPVRLADAPPSNGNAPLSLSPNSASEAAPAPERAAPARRTAVAAPPAGISPAAANGASGGYAVQVSSRRSEADAQAAFRTLQGKFPEQLGNRQPLIHRVDLGAKGIYFRAMVGPMASSNEASELCASLKAAGGQCFVQRN